MNSVMPFKIIEDNGIRDDLAEAQDGIQLIAQILEPPENTKQFGFNHNANNHKNKPSETATANRCPTGVCGRSVASEHTNSR